MCRGADVDNNLRGVPKGRRAGGLGQVKHGNQAGAVSGVREVSTVFLTAVDWNHSRIRKFQQTRRQQLGKSVVGVIRCRRKRFGSRRAGRRPGVGMRMRVGMCQSTGLSGLREPGEGILGRGGSGDREMTVCVALVERTMLQDQVQPGRPRDASEHHHARRDVQREQPDRDPMGAEAGHVRCGRHPEKITVRILRWMQSAFSELLNRRCASVADPSVGFKRSPPARARRDTHGS